MCVVITAENQSYCGFTFIMFMLMLLLFGSTRTACNVKQTE